MPAVCFQFAEICIRNRLASDVNTVFLLCRAEFRGIDFAVLAVFIIERVFRIGLQLRDTVTGCEMRVVNRNQKGRKILAVRSLDECISGLCSAVNLNAVCGNSFERVASALLESGCGNALAAFIVDAFGEGAFDFRNDRKIAEIRIFSLGSGLAVRCQHRYIDFDRLVCIILLFRHFGGIRIDFVKFKNLSYLILRIAVVVCIKSDQAIQLQLITVPLG